METDDIIKARIEAVLPILNERQARIYLSAEAKALVGVGSQKLHYCLSPLIEIRHVKN